MHPDEETSLINRIHAATAEALTMLARPDTTARVTVIRGYLHLCTITAKKSHREALCRSLAELSELAMERGRHHLARKLLLLTDETRSSYLASTRHRAAS